VREVEQAWSTKTLLTCVACLPNCLPTYLPTNMLTYFGRAGLECQDFTDVRRRVLVFLRTLHFCCCFCHIFVDLIQNLATPCGIYPFQHHHFTTIHPRARQAAHLSTCWPDTVCLLANPPNYLPTAAPFYLYQTNHLFLPTYQRSTCLLTHPPRYLFH
jgi:hypothetical protein